jgi:hypothetical protein
MESETKYVDATAAASASTSVPSAMSTKAEVAF